MESLKLILQRMKSDSVCCSSLLFTFNIPCPPSYDILFFLEPPVEHSFMVHDAECIVLSMMCLGRGNKVGGWGAGDKVHQRQWIFAPV